MQLVGLGAPAGAEVDDHLRFESSGQFHRHRRAPILDASSPVCGHCAKCYHPLVRSQVAVGFAKNQDNMDGASFHFAAEAAASSFSTSSPNNYLESSTCTVMDRLALMSDAAV